MIWMKREKLMYKGFRSELKIGCYQRHVHSNVWVAALDVSSALHKDEVCQDLVQWKLLLLKLLNNIINEKNWAMIQSIVVNKTEIVNVGCYNELHFFPPITGQQTSQNIFVMCLVEKSVKGWNFVCTEVSWS